MCTVKLLKKGSLRDENTVCNFFEIFWVACALRSNLFLKFSSKILGVHTWLSENLGTKSEGTKYYPSPYKFRAFFHAVFRNEIKYSLIMYYPCELNRDTIKAKSLLSCLIHSTGLLSFVGNYQPGRFLGLSHRIRKNPREEYTDLGFD